MGVTNFIGEAWRTGRSIAKGLGVTFREMVFEQPVTVQYPDERVDVPDWFRGIPVQKTDLTTGEYKCTSCGLCVEACPVDVITLEWHTDPNTKKKTADRFAIDMSRCMLCNYCIEVCPFDSLVMASDFELSKINPENMVYEFEDLLRIGLQYSKAEEANVKPSKMTHPPWMFAEHTHATEADIMDPNGYLCRDPLDPKTRKQYVADIWEKYGPPKAEAEGDEAKADAKAAGETKPAGDARVGDPNKPADGPKATAAAADKTITQDTPTHKPVVNEPKTASAEAGPAKIASPKASVADPDEATEVRPDQNVPSKREGGEGSPS